MVTRDASGGTPEGARAEDATPARTAAVAALVSLFTGIVGALWIGRPSSYPFGPADRVTVSVTHLIEHGTAGAMLLAAALAGLLVTAGSAAAGPRTAVARAAGAVAAVQAVFFALVMADISLMNTLAYGIGLTAPVVVSAAVLLACVRGRRAGHAAAGIILTAVVVGAVLGHVGAETLPRFYRNVLRSFAAYDTRLLWGLVMAATAAAWAWVAHRLLRTALAGGPPAWSRPERARRWGRVVTIGAALCPLPYALVRMTWLTPWALDLAPSFDEPAVRVQGASLGIAAIVGSVLTLGLISRWGEVVPRWVPGLGGRSVPPSLAVVPGGVVATAACIAAPGFLVSGIESGGDGNGAAGLALSLLLFPFPVWGPLLGAAVVAYRLRRTAPRSAA